MLPTFFERVKPLLNARDTRARMLADTSKVDLRSVGRACKSSKKQLRLDVVAFSMFRKDSIDRIIFVLGVEA